MNQRLHISTTVILFSIFLQHKSSSKSTCLRILTSVQFSHSVVSDSLWPHRLQHIQFPLSNSNSQSLLKLMFIKSVMPSNHLILCHPFLLLPSIFLRIGVFSNESVLRIRWPKYWNFSFNISPSNEYSGLISFRMDWLDLLAFQRTLKSLLQYHSSNASILQCSDFFIVQLSHPFMTTGKTIALTRLTFVGKVMSLLFNMLSRLFIAFLPRSKHHCLWSHITFHYSPLMAGRLLSPKSNIFCISHILKYPKTLTILLKHRTQPKTEFQNSPVFGFCTQFYFMVEREVSSNAPDISWASYNSTQFWYYLPKDSIRFHR